MTTKSYLSHKKPIGKAHLARNITAQCTHEIEWWDAAFAVHHDIRDQTDGNITLGNMRQFNTKSSTWADLLRMHLPVGTRTYGNL